MSEPKSGRSWPIATPTLWAWSLLALWLTLVCGLALFHGLFTLAPLDKTEALQIGIAETMFRLHEWAVPQWNGHLYSDKPPLPYWLAELMWRRFGLTPELARVPAAVAASAGVGWLAWLLQRRISHQRPMREGWARAGLAGSLLALSPGWIAFGRTAVHDIYLALAVTMALSGYALGFAVPSHRTRPQIWALWIGLWCGLGFLAKGLLGIGLPLLVMAAHAALHPTSRHKLLRPGSLTLLCGGLFVVVSPWMGTLIAGQHWAYLQGFLEFSNLQRATQVVDGHDQPLFFYLPVLIGLLWPWWPMLLSALQQIWLRRHNWLQAEGSLNGLQRLAAVWLLVGLGLFSLIPTKLPGYILPLIPAAVLLIATAPRIPPWCLRLVAVQLGLLSAALLAGLVSIQLGHLGDYGQQLLATPMLTTWLGLASILSLLAAIYGGCGSVAVKRWLGLLISMLLMVTCLPSLAMTYRQLDQQPILELAKSVHHLHESAEVLYVLGRPRYSVVAEAELATIFGSPLKPPSPRPISSYANWQRHGGDPQALVLGICSSVKELEQSPLLRIKVLEQRRSYCLASSRRTTKNT